MAKIIDQFGDFVSDHLESQPDTIVSTLKFGYRAYIAALSTILATDRIARKPYASKWWGYRASTQWMMEGLKHPEKTAMVNLFFPCEPLLALGITPMFVEGISGFMRATAAEQGFIDYAEDQGIPKTLCSYHKICMGMGDSGVLQPRPVLLNTTIYCDANQLTFKYLAQQWDKPHYQVEVPRGPYTEDMIPFVREQLVDICGHLEEIYDQKLDPDRLRQIIHRENETTRLQRRAFDLMKEKYFPTTMGEQMNQIFYSHPLKGSQQAYDYYQHFVADLEKAPLWKDDPHPRIFWFHTLPQGIADFNAFFAAGGDLQLLFSDINLDMLELLDEEDPYRAMAQRIVWGTMREGIESRNQTALQQAQELHAQGLIYFNHWGCRMTLGGSQQAQQLFEAAGIPVLLLDGDGANPNNSNLGQMKTKIQAFAEMLKGEMPDELPL